MNTSTESASGGYGAGIRGMHWLLFGLFAAQYVLVWLFDAFGDHGPTHSTIVATHMSVGTLILIVAGVMIVSRVVGTQPSRHFLPTWQQRMAVWVHSAIYGLMLAQPLIGLIMVMGHGDGVPVFGLFTLPPLIHSAPGWIFTAHSYVGWTLFWLLVVHILAALYHALVRRDGVLQRMLTSRG